MKFYYKIKSRGKCGCATTTWRVTEEFETKKSLKNRNPKAAEVLTEEQLNNKYKESAELIKSRSIKW